MIHYIVGLPYKIWAFLAFKYKFKKPYVLLDIRRAPSQMYQRQIFVKRAPKAHTTTLCVCVCKGRPLRALPTSWYGAYHTFTRVKIIGKGCNIVFYKVFLSRADAK